MQWLSGLREQLRTSLWFVPALFSVAAILLAVATLGLDRALADRGDVLPVTFSGTAEGARSVLSVVAQSMLTFTGLVFSITMLVLQLASSQLSPRVMRTFLRDRGNQVVLGLFVATFLYALIVLLEVHAPVNGRDGFVPSLSVLVAFALLLASVAAFIYYIDHMAHAIRASTVIASIWSETVERIDERLPDPYNPGSDEGERWPWAVADGRVTATSRAGTIVAVDQARLLQAAVAGAGAIEIVATLGDFVPEGAPIARSWGDWSDVAGEVDAAVVIARERTLQQDVAFGIRQLVDVATRALSPGVNDPTTAVQVLDRVHDLLRRIAARDLPQSMYRDDTGLPRVLVHHPTWDDLVRLGLDEIRLAGQTQIQVCRRLRAVLLDLLDAAPAERSPILRQELEMLDAAVERSFDDPADRRVALTPSARGHGPRTHRDAV